MAKKYVALLRGINVGGKNKVPMTELRETLEEGGYESVRTYIQSGNVLFESPRPRSEIEEHIEGLLEARFGIPLLVVVRSHSQMRKTVERAPEGFGTKPDLYYSDALFLKAPLTSKQVMDVVEIREGVDAAWPGDGVVYFQRLGAERTKSKLNRIASTPEYKLITIRSWATTTKLLEMLEKA
ncbi:MAG TPA: DUF1697 domain-containing protein [Acidimicrobiia bacterium]